MGIDKRAMREFLDYKKVPASAVRVKALPNRYSFKRNLTLDNVGEAIAKRYPKGTPEAKLLGPTTDALASLKRSVEKSRNKMRPSDLSIAFGGSGDSFWPMGSAKGKASATSLGPATIGHELGHGIDHSRGLKMGERGFFGIGGKPKTMIPSEVSATRHAIRHIMQGRPVSKLPPSARAEIAKILSATSTYIEAAAPGRWKSPKGLKATLSKAREQVDPATYKRQMKLDKIIGGLYDRNRRFDKDPKFVALKDRRHAILKEQVDLDNNWLNRTPSEAKKYQKLEAELVDVDKKLAPFKKREKYVKGRVKEFTARRENIRNPYKSRVWEKMSPRQRKKFLLGVEGMGKEIDKYFGKEMGQLYRSELSSRVSKPDMRGLADRKAAWRGVEPKDIAKRNRERRWGSSVVKQKGHLEKAKALLTSKAGKNIGKGIGAATAAAMLWKLLRRGR
tara:strand:- start:6937 stop:8280 length:1344 start_codon:yes stop_codon:yes gene_type:complete